MQRYSTGLLSFVLITVFAFSNAHDDNKSNSDDERTNTAEITGRSIPAYVDCSTKLGAWYGDKNDCRKFYICVMGNAIEQECQEGEFFDDARKSCRPGNCQTSKSKPAKKDSVKLSGKVNMPMPKQSPDVEQCEEGAIIPNEFDTKKFYVCYDGALRSQNCPNGMRFSAAQGYCMAGNSGMNCGSVPHGGFGPASTPNAFYVCNNGEMVLQLCPMGQLFNPMLGYCTRFRPSPPPIRPPPPPPPSPPSLSCGGYPQGSFIADVIDETKYWICIFGELRPQYCPTGMVFNNQTLYCVKGPTTTPIGSCGPYSPGAKIPDCNNCTNYLICTMGVFLIQTCPAGSSYNNATQDCTGTGNCGGGNGGGNGGGSGGGNGGGGGSGGGTSCGSSNDGQNQPITGQLQSYNKCLNGQWTSMTCSSKQIFSPILLACYDPCSISALGNGGLYAANPINPNSYINCNAPSSSNSIVTQNCPTGNFSMALNNLTPPCIQTPLPACPTGNTYTNIPYIPTGYTSPGLGTSQYYVSCNNGAGTLQRCPTEFVLYQGSCYKLNFSRSQRNQKNPRNIYIESLEDPRTDLCHNKKHGSYIPIEGDCQKFYVCLDSVPIEHACPRRQYFDPVKRLCAANDRGQCHNGYIKNTEPINNKLEKETHQTASTTDTDCFGKHGIFIADPSDCRRYFTCVNGWKIGQTCNYGERFDRHTQSCIFDYDDSCSVFNFHQLFTVTNQIETSLEEEDESVIFDESCMGRDPGEQFENKEDCTGYYVCSKGVAIPKQCPTEQYFDPIERLCRPSNGSCSPYQTEEEQPDDIALYLAASDTTPVCIGKHGIIVPDQKDCKSFYLCIYGRAHHDRCYDGEYFDSRQRHCIKNQGQCETATTESEMQHSDEEKQPSNICNGYFDKTNLPDPSNCNHFYVCIDGIPVPGKCGENEFFDSIHGYCRQNQNGSNSCSNAPSEENVCSGKHGIHVEHPADCRKYYLCVNGQALVHDCNINEYFNMRTGSCILDVDGKCSGMQDQPKDTTAEVVGEGKDDAENEVNKNQKPVRPAVNPFAVSDQIEENKHEGPKTSIPVCIPGIPQSMFYPNVDDGCQTFYECVDGRPIIHSCPIGFLYNAVLNICDVPDFVECTHTMNIKETRDPSCEGAVSGIRYANFGNDCQSFYVCSHGSAVQTFCGEGLRYNPIMGVCDWSANVHCITSNGVVISNS